MKKTVKIHVDSTTEDLISYIQDKRIEQSVNLSGNKIAAAPAIAAAFKDTGVTSVDLSYNEIGDAAPAIAAAFKDTGVTSVDLSHNKIGDAAPATAAAFKDTGITSVNLSMNKIAGAGAATAAAFKDTGVTSVNLSGNEIGNFAPATATALKDTGITSVDLSGNTVTFEQALQCLDIIWDNGQIHKLSLDHKEQCNNLLNECIKTLVNEEFSEPFADVLQALIGNYANITDFDAD